MHYTLEETFSAWSKGPGKSEEDRINNAINAIKDAISSSRKLNQKDLNIFLQGSYKNRVNVRENSDVDIGVCCNDVFFTDYPEGITDATFGFICSTYPFSEFKNDLQEALINKFGDRSVKRGNKAFTIKENSYRVEADVAPFYKHQRYSPDKSYTTGVEMRTDDYTRIINWPKQHYQNGVHKNDICRRMYKRSVRILKNLSIDMEENGITSPQRIPGFLLECLVWNVPNICFKHNTYTLIIEDCLKHLLRSTMTEYKSQDWGEVSELKYLFRSGQPWTVQDVNNFVNDALLYLGV